MHLRLNRELKAYCNDFTTARQLLRDHGASFVEIKEQVDYYYRLPSADSADGTRRLKLRIEHGKGELIYYREGQEAGARTSRFQTASTDDPMMGDVLAAALASAPSSASSGNCGAWITSCSTWTPLKLSAKSWRWRSRRGMAAT